MSGDVSFCSALVLAAVFLPFMPAHSSPVQIGAGDDAARPPTALSARSSPGDLEIGGELAGVAAGSVRYLRYDDLLMLPQETYEVADDSNFKGKTRISGVPLAELARLFGEPGHSGMVVAICYDKYHAHYPSEYFASHRPILVLRIDGQTRAKWPRSEFGGELGPYLISHPSYKPSYTVLSHVDEAQIPFGVTRIDFRSESRVYAAIKPEGEWTESSQEWLGYRIAREDCFRCHDMRGEGGQRAGRSWLVLAARAANAPDKFKSYIRNPKSVNPTAGMPAHKDYDDATLAALTAYFRTFAPVRKSE